MSNDMSVFLILNIVLIVGSLALVSLYRMFRSGLGVGFLGLFTFPFGPMVFFWLSVYGAIETKNKKLKHDDGSDVHGEFIAKYNKERSG